MDPRAIHFTIAVCGTFVAGQSRALAQETTRVNVSSEGQQAEYAWDGGSYAECISGDGLVVAFESDAGNLVAGDTNGIRDVFVHDCTTGVTERVSVDSSGAEANDVSWPWSISGDGRVVAFTSWASNLVSDDTNGLYDVFVHDRTTGLTERVCVDSSGIEANSWSDWPMISADGRFVAFASNASNLVPDDTNNLADIFVHDRTTGSTERVSVDSSGAEANDYSTDSGISGDGRFVVFQSGATNLVPGDTNRSADVFLRDRATGTTERISLDAWGGQAEKGGAGMVISPDGRFVEFVSVSPNIVAGDTSGIPGLFVRDRVTGSTERVSVDSAGVPIPDCSGGQISADGRFAVFESGNPNVVPGDTNGAYDVFIHDRVTGMTERVSVDSSGAQANYGGEINSFQPISADGQRIVFESGSTNLVADDTNDSGDIFVRDRGPLRAAWLNLGAGFPGTLGVPALTARTAPVLGSSVTIDLGDSCGDYAVALLVVGFEPASIHSSWGGDLLVVPFSSELVGVSPWGTFFFGDIPDDEALSGCVVELQALESDPGAAKGVSFTPALKLVLGH
jgi:WD40 repeat protein